MKKNEKNSTIQPYQKVVIQDIIPKDSLLSIHLSFHMYLELSTPITHGDLQFLGDEMLERVDSYFEDEGKKISKVEAMADNGWD